MRVERPGRSPHGARWVEEHHDLLVGLRALRRLGPVAADAIEAVMELPPVRRLRLSWELAVALAESEGRDGRESLVELIGAENVELVEVALFDVRPRLVCLDGGAE